MVFVAVAAEIAPLAPMVVIPLRAPDEDTSKFVELMVRALLPPPRSMVPVPVTAKLPLV